MNKDLSTMLALVVREIVSGADIALAPIPIDRFGYVPTREWWGAIEARLLDRLDRTGWPHPMVERPLGPVSQVYTKANGEIVVTHEPWEQKSIVVRSDKATATLTMDLVNHECTVYVGESSA